MTHTPVSGSEGRSDSWLLDEAEDFTGTGKKPRRKSAMANTWAIITNEANTDVRIFMLFVSLTNGEFKKNESSLARCPETSY